MNNLPVISMDFETRSDVDITKCGSYAYIHSPNFAPLLLSWSIDGGKVQTVDFTRVYINEDSWRSILWDKDYLKTAYNVAFEREVWSVILGERSPIEQWQDTQVLAAYAGLPRRLADVGPALGLPEDKQKLKTGNDLIRFFCIPYKGAFRDPAKYPEKWQQFIDYNRQDVVTERTIRDILIQSFGFPDREQKLWQLDQEINDRGIQIDTKLVGHAIGFANRERDRLMQEAKDISHLDNPNSVAQLKSFLELDEDQTLRKADVANLLKTVEDKDQKRILEIRSELGMSSVKKYEAMARSACPDGRVHGALLFYGANRTGRWCLTGDHEVLTQDGWVRLDQWQGGRIICWNPQNDLYSFQNSEAVSFDYNGTMYEYNDVRIKQISTPEHKMYYKPSYGSSWREGTVESFKDHRPIFPLIGNRLSVPPHDADQIRVLVMTQADGCYTVDKYLRFRFKKERKIQRCKSLLRRVAIPFRESTNNDGSTAITIPVRNLPLWLRSFRNKTFGWWLLDENADAFFEELAEWDGSKVGPNSVQYSTTNKQNADIIQALAHLSGRTANILVKTREGKDWNPRYVVNIWNTPGAEHRVQRRATQVDYSGKVYCATTPTGYFLVRRNGTAWITGNSGRLIQPQNFTKHHIPEEELDYARELVKEGDIDSLKLLFGSVNDMLSQMTRTAMVPREGCAFAVADFSAIEARVIAWLAKESWRMQAFAAGKDIYCESASQMFHVPVEKHGVNADLRQKGKIAELALGYGGSVGAMLNMGADKMGLSEEELQEIVYKWRNSSPKIVNLWYNIGETCLATVKGRQNYECVNGIVISRVTAAGIPVLRLMLPSGRYLHYLDPQIGTNRFGGESLTYMGYDAGKWSRVETFGGKIVENIVQAIARDCLAEAMQRVSEKGYCICFHVHDEMIVEVERDEADQALKDMLDCMAKPIDWAPGLLLKGDGYLCRYYIKR